MLNRDRSCCGNGHSGFAGCEAECQFMCCLDAQRDAVRDRATKNLTAREDK